MPHVKERFSGEAYWPDDWDDWVPTKRGSTTQSGGGAEARDDEPSMLATDSSVEPGRN